MTLKKYDTWYWHWILLPMAFLMGLGEGRTGSAGPAVLNSPLKSTNDFEFLLTGESPATYVIEASSDLQNWYPVLTNDSRGITRLMTITSAPADRAFCRAVRAPTPLFRFAIAANASITLSGGAIIDSFDSSDPAYSTGGLYDPAKRKDTAAVITNDRTTNAIRVGTASIYGTVATGPGGLATTSGGTVGDKAWVSSQFGIQPGHALNDISVSFPTNHAPVGTFPPPVVTSINGSNITYLATGTNEVSSFTSSSSTKPLIVTGNAVLIVDGDFTVSGSGYVRIIPGASLILYVGGRATVAGGGIFNETGLASNFSYFGLPTNTQFDYSGSAPLIGTVNAPQASLTVSGGVNATGACIANSITMTGGSGLHYDENLARIGPIY
jgi:Putative Ice-binding-like adhesive domain